MKFRALAVAVDLATLLLLSVLSSCLGLYDHQNISSHGSINYSSRKPILLIFPPETPLNEAIVTNVVSATSDLDEYFDIVYYLHWHQWQDDFARLVELIDLFAPEKVAVMEIHGYESDTGHPGELLLTRDQVTLLKSMYANLVGLAVREYIGSRPNDRTVISCLEEVLSIGKDLGLWVTIESAWWLSGGYPWNAVNFTAIDPLIRRYNQTVILSTKTTGVISQPFSWGVCHGYSLTYGSRWGILVDSHYWYELRDEKTWLDSLYCPIDLMISPIIYCLMHDASYVAFEPPWYFFEDDGTARDSLDTWKQALIRYFENGAPKVSPNKVAFLNLPFNENYPGLCLAYDPYSTFPGGLTNNTECTSPLNITYGFGKYSAHGLVNTKKLIPVLPYPTSINILKDFNFFLVPDPLYLWNTPEIKDYTFMQDNRTKEVYEYLVVASKHADLFLNARIFTLKYTGDMWNPDEIFMDHSELTGIAKPYEWHAIPGGEREIIWNHTDYQKKEVITLTFENILISGTRIEGCSTIAVINGTYEWIYEYDNPYGHKVYSLFEYPSYSRTLWDCRYKAWAFLENITKGLSEHLEKETGVLVYHYEYNLSRQDIADRDPLSYLCNSSGNYVLYAPFEYTGGKYKVVLAQDYPYAFIKNGTDWNNLFLSYCDTFINSVSFSQQSLIIDLWRDWGRAELKIYCDELGAPMSIDNGELAEYNSTSKIATILTDDFTSMLTLTVEFA